MDCSAPTPRVNGEGLKAYVGRKVLLVLRQAGLEDNVMRGTAADGFQARDSSTSRSSPCSLFGRPRPGN